MSISRFSIFFIPVIFMACGPSAEEIKLRERIVTDSMNRIIDSINDLKLRKNRSGSSSVRFSKRISQSGNEGRIEFGKLKIEYQYDTHAFNRSADIDCKIINSSEYAFTDFVFRIDCFNEYGDNIKSFEKTINKTVKARSTGKCVISFSKVKKTKTVKVDLVNATQLN